MQTPLHERAATQSGVLLTRQALELGWTWESFQTMVRTQDWVRLWRGTYLMPGAADEPSVRARAVQLQHPELVASHELAAAIHGWDLVGSPHIQFTAVRPGRWQVPGAKILRWALPPEDVAEVGGRIVTTPARTACDLMRSLRLHDAVIAVDSALRAGAVSLDDLAARLENLAGERGIRNAWRCFPRLEPRSQSVTESKTRMICWDRKLFPRVQVPVIGSNGRVYYADLEIEGVFVEPEGFAYHGSPEAHQADVNRFNALLAAAKFRGNDAIRLTYEDAFFREFETGKLIERTVQARRRRMGSPSGAPSS